MVRKIMSDKYNYESPHTKTFGGKTYIFMGAFDNEFPAKQEAEMWREHDVPARIWKNDVGRFAVYTMKGRTYKKTSAQKLKRDWSYHLAPPIRRRRK